jgi:hypothetical protein
VRSLSDAPDFTQRGVAQADNRYAPTIASKIRLTIVIERWPGAQGAGHYTAFCLDWWVKLEKAITAFASVVYIQIAHHRRSGPRDIQVIILDLNSTFSEPLC